MTEPTDRQRRFTGAQLTTMFIATLIAIVAIPVGVQAATPTGVQIIDRGILSRKAAITAYGQLAVAGPVSVTGTAATAANDLTTLVAGVKLCDGTLPTTFALKTDGYKQLRVNVRNSNTGQTAFNFMALNTVGAVTYSTSLASAAINPAISQSFLIDTPGISSRLDCSASGTDGVFISVLGRRN